MKKMMPLSNEEKQSYQDKIFAIYVKRTLVLITKNTIKSNIIAITLKNINQLLTIFVI